jgi:NADPH:quinone reductase-like Zn-dependent oxidoreductase
MKQIWITRPGGPAVLQLQDAPDPIPRSGEVRIRVEVSGVNFADILGRMGLSRNAPAMPYVPGYEVAGVIDAVAQGVADLKEGDAVFAATRFGGYSDVVCVPARQVFKRLEWMTAGHGAALPVNYLTAYAGLVVMGSLRAGDRVLIHGAAGGLGLAALAICKIMGAETYGTASAAKHDFLREQGLHHPLNYHNPDYERVIHEITAGQGLHLVLDTLGGIHWHKNFRLLAPTGRLVYAGVSAIAPGKRRSWPAALRWLLKLPFYTPLQLMNANKAIIGVNLGKLWDQAEMQRAWMRQIIAWYDDALFRPHIDRIFKFSEAAEAHDYIQDRKNCGKVLLAP